MIDSVITIGYEQIANTIVYGIHDREGEERMSGSPCYFIFFGFVLVDKTMHFSLKVFVILSIL